MNACVSQSEAKVHAPSTVLVVDGDALVREYLTLILESAGYTVATAGSGEEMLQALQLSHFETVIADFGVPGMDGPSLCRCIRERQLKGYPYILVFTIDADANDIATALQAGADDYIVKGTPMRELLASLDKASRLRCTGLEQRRHAADSAMALDREYRECRGRDAPISLLLCALDEGGSLGAGIEMQARSALVTALRTEIPKYLLQSEWLAPRGREEIMVVLPDAEPKVAQLVAQKIRRAVQAVIASHPNGLGPVTVSIGIASLAVGPGSNALMPADLIRACERSLVESRRRGGDCITTTSVQWLP